MLDRLLIQLFYRESEIGIGERLVLQGEVPPLGIEGLEAVGEHGAAQNHAVGELLDGDAALRFNRRFRIVARVLARFGIAAEVGVDT